MKKFLVLALVLVVVMAVAAFAGVQNTPHDLSGGAAEICVACHTPHGSASSTNGPLWNRSQGSAVYTMYTSATFDMTPTSNPPGPQSLACLTCHNGVASTLVNYPGTGSTPNALYDMSSAKLNAMANVGVDLSNDHPVGFTYNASRDSNSNGFPAASTFPLSNMRLYSNGNGSDQMECATCHDVHNQAVPAKSPVYFLRTANTNSAMCQVCHVNKF